MMMMMMMITGYNYLDFIQQILISCLWIALHELNDNLKDRNSMAITWILNFNKNFLRPRFILNKGKMKSTLLIAVFSFIRFINGIYSSEACISMYSAKATSSNKP